MNNSITNLEILDQHTITSHNVKYFRQKEKKIFNIKFEID